jgi:hypothetical protein
VDGVGDECSELEEVEPLELVFEGDAGAGSGTGSATGGAGFATGGVVSANVGPWNGSPVVLEFWHCSFFPSQESVNVFSVEFCPQFLLCSCYLFKCCLCCLVYAQFSLMACASFQRCPFLI